MNLTRYQVPAWPRRNRLVHVFLGRRGGGSRSPYASLNLSYRVGDDALVVGDNVCSVKKALGLYDLPIVTMSQQHGDRIIDIPGPVEEAGAGDAMVTAMPGVFLGVLTADCTPILIWSTGGGQNLAAVVHAGWRGTLAGLAAKTVTHIEKRYRVSPSALQCALGPSIDDCCYEVGSDVATAFYKEWAERASRFIRPVHDRFHLDLRGLNTMFLTNAGVPGHQISSIGPCTSCTPREFFSYRRETKAHRSRTGRQMSLIGWMP